MDQKQIILDICTATRSKDPLEILQQMMDDPNIRIHGPEHHIMVGSALLAAYKNAGGKLDLPHALEEMAVRGEKYPGGSCGYWGCCGAAVSVGMFMSIVTNATPLSGKNWGQGNRATAKCLQAIGEVGGPRCCKRNSFTAVCMATAFAADELGVAMALPKTHTCRYFQQNKQCLGTLCPYHP